MAAMLLCVAGCSKAKGGDRGGKSAPDPSAAQASRYARELGLPLYPGSKFLAFRTEEKKGQAGGTSRLEVATADSVAKVVEFYKGALGEKAILQQATEGKAEAAVFVLPEADGARTVNVVSVPEKGETRIALMKSGKG